VKKSFPLPDKTGPITFGVLSDTHIPDRGKTSPSMPFCRRWIIARVDGILHAGDAANYEG
jgi:predicted phosphodiesterase